MAFEWESVPSYSKTSSPVNGKLEFYETWELRIGHIYLAVTNGHSNYLNQWVGHLNVPLALCEPIVLSAKTADQAKAEIIGLKIANIERQIESLKAFSVSSTFKCASCACKRKILRKRPKSKSRPRR